MPLAILLTHDITEAAFPIIPTAQVKKSSLLEVKLLAMVNSSQNSYFSLSDTKIYVPNI